MWQHISTIAECIIAACALVGTVTVVIKVIAFQLDMKKDIDLVLTNHLPHIQAELEGLRADMRAYYGGNKS